MKIERRLILIILVLFIAALFYGCDSGTGSVTLNLTDAPVDNPSIKEVNITVTGIGYQIGEDEDGSWVDIDFDSTHPYNLLDLTGGDYEMLGQFNLPGGKITQLRFYLDVPETSDTPPSNPGCYLVLEGNTDSDDDDEEAALFVPSGGTSGFKATGEFDVPVNGTVEITADFDARKSIVTTGASTYILKPTIRLIVNNEAGTITGAVTYTGTNTPVVFVYENDTYESSELTAETDTSAFPTAVSSSGITDPDLDDTTEELVYTLAFLAAGTYDLVFVELDAEGDYIADSVKFLNDVTVTSRETTTANFDYTTEIE